MHTILQVYKIHSVLFNKTKPFSDVTTTVDCLGFELSWFEKCNLYTSRSWCLQMLKHNPTQPRHSSQITKLRQLLIALLIAHITNSDTLSARTQFTYMFHGAYIAHVILHRKFKIQRSFLAKLIFFNTTMFCCIQHSKLVCFISSFDLAI